MMCIANRCFFFGLQRRGPQRSVDVIVSAAFILTLLLLAFLSVEWLKVFSKYYLQAEHVSTGLHFKFQFQ